MPALRDIMAFVGLVTVAVSAAVISPPVAGLVVGGVLILWATVEEIKR